MPQTAYSSADPRPEAGLPAAFQYLRGGFTDSAADQPASAENTFTYSVNLSRCLRDTKGVSWQSGEAREFTFMGSNGPDNARVRVHFKRSGGPRR